MNSAAEACSTIWFFWQSVDWLEWARTLFDLVKGVSWPLAIFAMVWLFKEPIRARIPFITQVGPTGATFGSQPAAPQGSNPLHTADHPLATVNSLAAQISEEILEFVQEQREAKLVRALAEARVLTEFEFIFANIFQSQIDAMRELKNGPKSVAEAKVYFDEHVRPINMELYSVWDFDKWSFFLTAQSLVVVVDDQVELTVKGRDFLDFVSTRKIGLYRPN